MTHRFNVSAERVFDAWLDPAKVKQWFGPGLGEMVRVDVEPRVGGTFSFVQRRGNDAIDHVGVYLVTHEMPQQWAEFAPRSAAAWSKMACAMAAALA